VFKNTKNHYFSNSGGGGKCPCQPPPSPNDVPGAGAQFLKRVGMKVVFIGLYRHIKTTYDYRPIKTTYPELSDLYPWISIN